MKTRTKIQLILVGCLIIVPTLLCVFGVYGSFFLTAPLDVDKIEEGPYAGNYLVTEGMGAVRIVNFATHQVLWETTIPSSFVHEADMMPGGNSIIIADTGADRTIEVDIASGAIVWEWNALNSTHINWTKFALDQGWGQSSIDILEDQVPSMGYYTHLNTVQFLNGSDFGRTYDTILMSPRNFDLVIEVNYTAKFGEPGFRNITWYYGEPGNHDILFHQHGPKRWNELGHINTTTIVDSENGRVIEVNQSGHIVWEFTGLRWPRDCELLPNGNWLITDSDNSRVIEVSNSSNEILRTFSLLVAVPYEADYVQADNQVLIGNTFGNSILVFDYETGQLVNMVGFPWGIASVLFIFLVDIGYQAANLAYIWRKHPGKTWKERIKSPEVYKLAISLGILVGNTLLFFYLIGTVHHFVIHHTIEHIPRFAG